jgi:predicted nucleic acid-binding protein
MILVDASIWVDRLRKSNQPLADLLEHGAVLIHPGIIGELVLGGLNDQALQLMMGCREPRWRPRTKCST